MEREVRKGEIDRERRREKDESANLPKLSFINGALMRVPWESTLIRSLLHSN